MSERVRERVRECVPNVQGSYMWVIPRQFNKNFQMTVSDLDETWYAGSTFGFVKPDKISLSFIVWVPG